MADEKSSTLELADKDLEVIDNIEDAPLIYVDGAQGIALLHGAVKINLYQILQTLAKDSPGPSFKKLVVARLAMSPQVARSLADWLGKHVAKIEGDVQVTGKPSNGD